MRIASVIARAKKTVQAGGLPGIVVELSDTLRSEAIPAPLRHAAARLADMLRAPEPAERVVVPLVSDHGPERAPHAIDADMNARHGGVCPFTGHAAAPGEAVDEERARPELDAERQETAPGPSAVAEEVVDELVAEVAEAAAAVHAPEPALAAPEAAASSLQAAPEKAPAPKGKKPVASSAPSKSVAPAKPVPPQAKRKNEKSREELAAKPSAAKTSARSSKGPGKQPGKKKKK